MTISLVRVPQGEITPAEEYSDYTVCQTDAWIKFLEETQHAEPVYAHVLYSGKIIGRFVGLLVRKFGIPILGSPMRGWTSSYMGFNLKEDIPRIAALRALSEFAFTDLGCMHLEIFDRHMNAEELDKDGYEFFHQGTFEIDLNKSDDELLRAMSHGCRQDIRKAQRSGVQIEVATDDEFVSEYYRQLREVFEKQRLVPAYDIGRVSSLVRNVMPTGKLLLLRALDSTRRCIATGIFPAANTTMYFWGGASWRAHQHLRPNQILQWTAMMYWKRRGITRYDMGGGGDYKRLYGGREIAVPWVMVSKYRSIYVLRNCAQFSWRIRQRALGLAGRLHDLTFRIFA